VGQLLHAAAHVHSWQADRLIANACRTCDANVMVLLCEVLSLPRARARRTYRLVSEMTARRLCERTTPPDATATDTGISTQRIAACVRACVDVGPLGNPSLVDTPGNTADCRLRDPVPWPWLCSLGSSGDRRLLIWLCWLGRQAADRGRSGGPGRPRLSADLDWMWLCWIWICICQSWIRICWVRFAKVTAAGERPHMIPAGWWRPGPFVRCGSLLNLTRGLLVWIWRGWRRCVQGGSVT
jgi:hypothetical protein